MRTKYKSWQNRRPGWTRRVTSYRRDDESGGWTDVRLCFEDESGKVNRYYSNLESSQVAFDAFRNGEMDVPTLRSEIPDPIKVCTLP